MFLVYILRSTRYKKSYVGFTDNLERRIQEYNSGKQYYTKRYMPWEIVYKEEFATRDDAVTREKFLKSTSGRRFLKTIFEKLN